MKVEAEPPIIKSENRLQEAQADQILLLAGVMSKESMAARHGLVYADERDKMEVESENGHGPGQPSTQNSVLGTQPPGAGPQSAAARASPCRKGCRIPRRPTARRSWQVDGGRGRRGGSKGSSSRRYSWERQGREAGSPPTTEPPNTPVWASTEAEKRIAATSKSPRGGHRDNSKSQKDDPRLLFLEIQRKILEKLLKNKHFAEDPKAGIWLSKVLTVFMDSLHSAPGQ